MLTKKDADGNVRQIATKKRYPGKAAYLGVGKDGKKPDDGDPPDNKPTKPAKPKSPPKNPPNIKQTDAEAMRFDSPFVLADLESAVGKEAADKFFEQMAAAPPEIREFWQKHKGFIRRINVTRGTSCESGGNVEINRGSLKENGWRKENGVLFHEFAHALDEAMSKDLPYDMSRRVWFKQHVSHELHDAIAKDYEAQIKLKTEDILNEAKAQLDRHGGKVTDALLDELVSEGRMSDFARAVYKGDNSNDRMLPDAIRAALGMKERNGRRVKISKAAAGFRLAQELNADESVLGAVCDAFRGKSGCSSMNVGHDMSYYKRWGGNADGVETFANLYAAYALQDEKTLEKVKKYLPETWEVFNNVLRKGAQS